ncbi:MAG: UDP-glucose/GDP-mannose dehydrogenase family protein [Thaumarchaeota archaeon]|nr:UDP-glucose/GDP-mannose dehydrogenase family protein [Nitrososphaerota archaeon]
MLRVAVIGTGYVGLTTAVCLASKGHHVTCVDIDKTKIAKIKSGEPMIHEEGLEPLLKRVLEESLLDATSNLEDALPKADISFICVGTPSLEDGSIDTSYIYSASKQIGSALVQRDGYHVVVVKSTVVPGTTDDIVVPNLRASGKKLGAEVGVCTNPEFLREGSSVQDFLNPANSGIVIGELDTRSGDLMVNLYRDFDAPILRTGIREAEMIKYARNAYLAKDISFANELANVCEVLELDYLRVKQGMELDSRIGKGRFLDAGLGYGGSCFKKDIRGLMSIASKYGIDMKLLRAVEEVNQGQPLRVIQLAKKFIGALQGKKISVLGLAFKPGTDDVRESRGIAVARAFLKEGSKVVGYDPLAMKNANLILDSIEYAKTIEAALEGSDLCVIATELEEFRNWELYDRIPIIDGRRVLPLDNIPKGVRLASIGFGKRPLPSSG